MKDKQLFIVFKLLEKDQMSVVNIELVEKQLYYYRSTSLYPVDLLRRSQVE